MRGGRKFCIFGQPGAVVVRAASSAPASARSASTASSAPALHLPGLACHRCRERRVPRPSVASLPPTSEHLPCMQSASLFSRSTFRRKWKWILLVFLLKLLYNFLTRSLLLKNHNQMLLRLDQFDSDKSCHQPREQNSVISEKDLEWQCFKVSSADFTKTMFQGDFLEKESEKSRSEECKRSNKTTWYSQESNVENLFVFRPISRAPFTFWGPLCPPIEVHSIEKHNITEFARQGEHLDVLLVALDCLKTFSSIFHSILRRTEHSLRRLKCFAKCPTHPLHPRGMATSSITTIQDTWIIFSKHTNTNRICKLGWPFEIFKFAICELQNSFQLRSLLCFSSYPQFQRLSNTWSTIPTICDLGNVTGNFTFPAYKLGFHTIPCFSKSVRSHYTLSTLDTPQRGCFAIKLKRLLHTFQLENRLSPAEDWNVFSQIKKLVVETFLM